MKNEKKEQAVSFPFSVTLGFYCFSFFYLII